MSTVQPKLSSKGTPYTSREAAEKVMQQQGMSNREFIAMPYQGGWAIVPVADFQAYLENPIDIAQAAAATAPAAVAKGPDPRRQYKRVRFQRKGSKEEPENVELCVNGDWLICARGKETIVPVAYLVAADNAVFDHYEQKPGHDRQVAGTVQKYPYTIIGDATEAEYQAMLKAGNKARDEATAQREGRTE